MPELTATLGHRYYTASTFHREMLLDQERPRVTPAPEAKTYPGAKRHPLPRPTNLPPVSLWETLARRRSRRRFAPGALALADLARLLWACQGITGPNQESWLRTAPSAGALHPLETYVAAREVDGLEPGLYHLDVAGFALEEIRRGDLTPAIATGAIHQAFVARAKAVFLWTAVFRRSTAKYGHRAFRYICMDAGHLCQNLLLAATGLGLAACPVAAFFDDEENDLLGIDGVEEGLLYLAAVG